MTNKLYVVFQPYEDEIYYVGPDPEQAGIALSSNLKSRDATQPRVEVWVDGCCQDRWDQYDQYPTDPSTPEATARQDLKPCPFKTVDVKGWEGHINFFIGDYPIALVPPPYSQQIKEAIKAWNTRTPSITVEELEGMKRPEKKIFSWLSFILTKDAEYNAALQAVIERIENDQNNG